MKIKDAAIAFVRDWIRPQHMSIVERLREWGTWGAMQNINYPSMSPMFGERALKTPLHAPSDATSDVLAVDAAVRKIHYSERALLIERYQLRMHWREICGKWCWSRSAYFRNLEEAHESVKAALDQ